MLSEFLDLDYLRIGSCVRVPKFLLSLRLCTKLAVLRFLSKFEGTPEAIKSLLSRLLFDCCLILRTTLEDLFGYKGNLEVPSLFPDPTP